MVNKLKLNKRPVINLPEDILIGEYERRFKRSSNIPDFEPNIIINNWGAKITISKEKKERAKQIWIKTDNEKLKEFILSYDWISELCSINKIYYLSTNKLKEVLLKEYYDKQTKVK